MSLLTNNSVDLSCLPSSEGGTEKLKRSKSLLTEQIRCSLISAGILLLSEFKDNIVYLHITLTRGDVCPFRSNWIKRLFNIYLLVWIYERTLTPLFTFLIANLKLCYL